MLELLLAEGSVLHSRESTTDCLSSHFLYLSPLSFFFPIQAHSPHNGATYTQGVSSPSMNATEMPRCVLESLT